MPNRILLLKATEIWDGTANYEFLILGKCDSDYAKNATQLRVKNGVSF